MALRTPSVTIEELKAQLREPYTPDEMARVRQWADGLTRFQQGPRWPVGTLQRLLDWADAEDDEHDG